MRWCDSLTDVPVQVVIDGKRVTRIDKVMCRWQNMTLQPTTVMGVPDIRAYVCPKCNKAKWIPGESIRPFLNGLYGPEVQTPTV